MQLLRASHGRFASAIATGLTLALTACTASAQQSFPTKPIRLIASTTAGSQPDGIARMIGQKLSESWGRPVVIDNRPGAQGVLAATTVAKAAPDGHSLLYALPNFAISAVLQPSLSYDPFRDFAGITQIRRLRTHCSRRAAPARAAESDQQGDRTNSRFAGRTRTAPEHQLRRGIEHTRGVRQDRSRAGGDIDQARRRCRTQAEVRAAVLARLRTR